MAEEKKDNWSTEAYQNAASFVPKLATKIVEWLDPQPDDVILDIGCGDGVLNIQFNEILSRGSGSVHGIDSSPAMIEAARKAAEKAGAEKCTFEVLDALSLSTVPALQTGSFTKLFSNAALHWILGGAHKHSTPSPSSPSSRASAFFRAARASLAPGGLFAFETGGLGNVAEMRAALLAAVGRRAGLARAAAADPWFFPDEAWARSAMEAEGWEVLRAEREWRPTRTGQGGVEAWVRLFGATFLELVPEGAEREECVREAVGVLELVCREPTGGFVLGYVRLRVLARRV
ncbi:S-adenosyl-L-methionine-dependent methyltransferase [Biscogniauxia sp. FL1348]|nr:S-adenosyl-L-methionine-dependent methyltransferase [Biscogniauxia sp. FL1348]